MLQLLSTPYSRSFARNPLLFRFLATDATGNRYRAIGVNSELRSTPATVIPAPESITLNWTEPDGTTGSETFTTAETPANENEFPDGRDYANTATFYNDVVAVLNAHPVVSALFSFYTNSFSGAYRSIFAEARELNDDWTISWDISSISSPNFSVIDTTTVTDSTAPDNYRLLWELMLETTYLSGSFEKVATGEAFIDADSEIYFDLQHIMDAEVRNSLADPPIPTYANTDVLVADNQRRYYIRYREEYDDIVSPAWTYGTTRYVINGGISQSLFAAGDWLAARSATTSILSWRPDNRRVSPAQKEYLPWFNYTGAAVNIAIEYQGTYGDGTGTGLAFKYTTPTVSARAGETLLIPVGYEQLGESDEDVVSYSVRVYDVDSPDPETLTYLSPTRTYQIDRHYRQPERFLMYLNGFGCPETLRLLGFFTNDNQVERVQAERILSPGYSTTTRQTFQSSKRWQNLFTYRTGYLPRLELDSLQEMFVENEVYEIYEQAYIPLYITTDTMPVTETRQQLHSLTFQAIPALAQQNYSNVIPEPEEAGGYWLQTDGGYWLTILGQPWELV